MNQPQPRPRKALDGLPGGVQVGRPFGVPIVVSPSWLIFLGWITLQFGPLVQANVAGIGNAAYVVSLAFGIILGLSVLAHELSHTAVAIRFGMPVRRISLTLLAGHAIFERDADTPWRAFAVAGAGPAANVAIAAASWGAYHSLLSPHTVGWVLTVGLAWSNGLVALYNLLPGLPMDGGQMLRALVWRVTGKPRLGTIGAAWTGRVIAAATAMAALWMMSRPSDQRSFDGVWLLLIAGFVWLGSTAVLRQQAVRDRLPAISARALTRRALPVTADLPLAEAVRRAQETQARGLIIVDGDGRPTGVVNEAAVTATPINRRPWVSVGSVSRSVAPPQLVPAQLSGEELLKQLQVEPASEYVVVEPDGAIYGVLAASDVAAALRH